MKIKRSELKKLINEQVKKQNHLEELFGFGKKKKPSPQPKAQKVDLSPIIKKIDGFIDQLEARIAEPITHDAPEAAQAKQIKQYKQDWNDEAPLEEGSFDQDFLSIAQAGAKDKDFKRKESRAVGRAVMQFLNGLKKDIMNLQNPKSNVLPMADFERIVQEELEKEVLRSFIAENKKNERKD